MLNRAKCRLCQCIIESKEPHDWVNCECGEIGISGGKDSYRCLANDFGNFIRVDDEGNDIVVTVKEKGSEIAPRLSKNDLLNMLDEMIKNIEELPDHAKLSSINHFDHASLLYLLSAIFRCKD